jgi:hypothetical protein
MALDTAAKRAAALGAGLTPGVILPVPDGEIDAADRAQLAGVALPSASAFETQRDFPVKRLRRDFYIRSNDVSDDYLFEDVVKDPAASRKVRLRLYALAANEWTPNEIVATGEHARPRMPNGFSYEATTGGTTAAREPLWPKAVGLTVTDGSVVWTCRAAAANGLNVVSSPSATSDPAGLTISSVAVAENTDIVATYSGGTEGTTYDAAFTWTLDGVPMVGRQQVRVAKQ